MTLSLVKDRLWKGGACTKPVQWDKQLGQAQPVPVGQADWVRLCLSQWDRQAACTKPVPLGLWQVKRYLSLSHGTSHIRTLEAFPCPGTSSTLTMELVPVPLVPTWPTNWVYKAVEYKKGDAFNLLCLRISFVVLFIHSDWCASKVGWECDWCAYNSTIRGGWCQNCVISLSHFNQLLYCNK